MSKIIIPTGGDVELETPEEKIAREAAEEAAKSKTPEQIEQERLEAERLKSEEDANKEGNVIPTIIIANEKGEETTFNLNETGDAVDSEGKIIYTAKEIEDLENGTDTDTDEVNDIESISKLSGIVVLNEDGTPKVYENTVEGFAQRESDIKKLGYIEASQKALTSFFEENEDLADMYKYKQTYGTLEGFTNHIDYGKLVLNKDDEGQLMDIIIKAELKKGTSLDRAKRMANLSKADNTLFIDAQESQSYMKTIQDKEFQEANDKKQRDLKDAIDKDNAYFGIEYKDGKEVILNVENSIYDLVVNKGSFGGLQIPIEGVTIKDPKGQPKHITRREIFDYISTPVAEVDGELYTQAQLDEYKRLSNKEEVITTYVKNLMGNNIEALISTSKLKDKANTIRRIQVKQSTQKPPVNNGNKKVVIPVRK